MATTVVSVRFPEDALALLDHRRGVTPRSEYVRRNIKRTLADVTGSEDEREQAEGQRIEPRRPSP